MKKVLKYLSLFLLVPMFSLNILCGCDLNIVDVNIFSGFDNDDYIEPDYRFDISSTDDKLIFDIANLGFDGDTLYIVALQPYEYLFSEDITGLSNDINVSPKFLAEFEGGIEQKIEIDRFFVYYEANEESEVSSLTDGVGLKYFVINDRDDVLAGPKFCTTFSAKYDYVDPIPAKSLKGVMCEDSIREEVFDLGCSHTQMNCVLNYMLLPNEVVENGQIKELEYTESYDRDGNMWVTRYETTEDGEGTPTTTEYKYKVEYIDYNGTRYYIRLDGSGFSVSNYDQKIKAYTDRGVRVTLILLFWPDTDQYNFPYFMNYPALYGKETSTYIQVNTSNKYGAGYWGALMEFLGRRYSYYDGNTAPNGLVYSYVVGNEVDYSSSWNGIVPSGHAPLSMMDYIEEYERTLRIANTSLKKYYDENLVLMPVTHNWSIAGEEYSPKNMFDYMTKKTLEQGNYDYGFAVHPYGADLTVTNYWQNDTRLASSLGMNGSLNTSLITYSNLEVFQLYLEQPGKLCNGKIRTVYITEGGITSDLDIESQSEQAAGIAYLYYKATQLSCIKAIIYYRLQDHPVEVAQGLGLGIVYSNSVDKKLSYTMYKYIDTNQSFTATEDYLKYFTWSINGNAHGIGIDKSDWHGVMGIFDSAFDWDSHWDTDLIMQRTGVEYIE